MGASRSNGDGSGKKLLVGLYTATTGSVAVLPIVADHANGPALWAVVSVTGLLAAASAFFTRHSLGRGAASSAEDPGSTEPAYVPPHNLPSLSRYFTGRDTELGRVREMLTDDDQQGAPRRIVVIHGMGGAGKTQLAVAHARTHAQADTATLTWWLPATSTERLRDRLLELAAILGVPAHESEYVVLARLWGWLRDNPGWLLVYDNVQPDGDETGPPADGPHGLEQFLPPDQCRGTILITTRVRQGWAELTEHRLELLGLSPTRGRAFLRLRIDGTAEDADDESLDALGKQLGWLPLDLETAGAYIEREGITVEEYLAQLPEHTSTNGFETFRLSVERISREAPEAENLLRLCSYLASEDVPHSALYEHRAVLPDGLRRAMESERVFHPMVRELVEHSLLTVSGDQRKGSVTFGVHPRVRQFIRSRMDQDDRVQWSQVAVRLVEAAFPAWPEQPEVRSACERLMPHADAVITEVSWASDDRIAYGTAHRALIELLHRVGVYQEQRCNWTRALTFFQWEAELRQDAGAPDGADALGRVTAQLAVARQHYLLAHLDDAHDECLKALVQCRRHTGDGPAFVELEALCHRQYGGVLREKILFDEALDAVREAVRIYEVQEDHEPGWESLEWAVAEQEIGMIHRNAGRLALALESYARAEARIPQRGSQVPAQHVLFRAMLRRDVGVVAQDRGDLGTAETELEAALAVFREHRGLEDFETSQVAKFLADVRRRQAEDLLEQARATWHPLRRRELRERGGEKLRSAAELLEPVLELHYNRSEAEPHKYAACLNKMGSLQAAQGLVVEALETFDTAHGIYTRKYGGDHHYRAKTLSRLGPVLLTAGDRAGAEVVLREAERIFRARLGDDHPSLVAVYERLAECTDDEREAADFLARAERIATALWHGTPARPDDTREDPALVAETRPS
ncbi:tetratricopeptide repeat protein [Streptomyces sp. NBC_00582]|uniref:tetratricopeptide repeat protein n=1 Tax=Streptomyces sp. NBC_00582 TaxID=2975783 RepID=UPI0010638C9A|nr:tetratricopeptide repeat protein [Streptomyces sp. NBC_00582]WUB65532.1 tetratricopeptide repeat protein [Streptomyces sp. NBC_00582]